MSRSTSHLILATMADLELIPDVKTPQVGGGGGTSANVTMGEYSRKYG